MSEGHQIRITIPKLNREIRTAGQVTLLELLKRHQVPIGHSCSGEAVCGFCRVKILDGEDELHPITIDEQRIIDKKNIPAGERLACQIWVECDLTIETDYW